MFGLVASFLFRLVWVGGEFFVLFCLVWLRVPFIWLFCFVWMVVSFFFNLNIFFCLAKLLFLAIIPSFGGRARRGWQGWRDG